MQRVGEAPVAPRAGQCRRARPAPTGVTTRRPGPRRAPRSSEWVPAPGDPFLRGPPGRRGSLSPRAPSRPRSGSDQGPRPARERAYWDPASGGELAVFTASKGRVCPGRRTGARTRRSTGPQRLPREDEDPPGSRAYAGRGGGAGAG